MLEQAENVIDALRAFNAAAARALRPLMDVLPEAWYGLACKAYLQQHRRLPGHAGADSRAVRGQAEGQGVLSVVKI